MWNKKGETSSLQMRYLLEKTESMKNKNPICKDKKYGHIYNLKGICIRCGVKYEKNNPKT